MVDIRGPRRRALAPLQLAQPNSMADLTFQVQSQPSALATGIQTGLVEGKQYLTEEMKKRKELAQLMALGQQSGLSESTLNELGARPETRLAAINALTSKKVTEGLKTLPERETEALQRRKLAAEAAKLEFEARGAGKTDKTKPVIKKSALKGLSEIPENAYVLDDTEGAGKQIPSPTVLNVNEGSAVANKLPDISKLIKDNPNVFGPVVGRIRSGNPYDKDAQAVDSEMRTSSQQFGRFMEGGVLRKEDEYKYRKMFPQGGDTPDVAESKLLNVQRVLALKYNSDIKALRDSGYDTTGFKELEVPESLATRLERGKLPKFPVNGGPSVGSVENGYRFKGGNPADRASWEKL